MEYNIQAPDNVVEASYSTDPDDVSVVSVRIVATLEPATESLGDLKAIEFVVPPELTTNPSSITPQAHSFADWEMQVQGATFVASPRWPSEQSPGGSVNQPSPPDGGWVFYLRDVEIVDSPGSAEITVREVRGAQTDEKGRLKLRKIHPSLRIDYFRVIDADGEPLDASTRSTEPVTLAWATTSATSVSLWGPSIDGLGDPRRSGERRRQRHDPPRDHQRLHAGRQQRLVAHRRPGHRHGHGPDGGGQDAG